MDTPENKDGSSGEGTAGAGQSDGKLGQTNAEGLPKQDETQKGTLASVGASGGGPRAGDGGAKKGQGPGAGPDGMAKIMKELDKIRDWGNGMADSVDEVTANLGKLVEIVEKVSGEMQTLNSKTDQMQGRLDGMGDGGGISIALFRELEERVNEVADMAKGPMSGVEQKAHLAKQMGKASKAQGESRMMYHKELPPKVAGNPAQVAEFEDMGYKETPLLAAGGDKQLAKQIHERAAAD